MPVGTVCQLHAGTFLVGKVLSKTHYTYVLREDWIVVIHEPRAQWRIPGRINIQYNTIPSSESNMLYMQIS